MDGRKIRVYLAGPISGCNERQRSAWRNEAREKLGREFEVCDPVETTQGRDQSPAAIVERDRKAIRECDAVLANMWRESIGTAIGIVHAWSEAKIIVVADPNHIGSRLIRYYADDVTESIGDAVKSLKQILRAEDAIRSVIKRSGKVEPFQRKKLARAIRRTCWAAGLDDVLYPAPVRREVLAALLRHGADLGGAVTTTTIEDCVLTVLQAMEKRQPEYARVRETWQGYLEKRRPPAMMAARGAAAGASAASRTRAGAGDGSRAGAAPAGGEAGATAPEGAVDAAAVDGHASPGVNGAAGGGHGPVAASDSEGAGHPAGDAAESAAAALRSEPRVFPTPQRITVESDKSHGTIWGPRVGRLVEIPDPARSLFREIARVEYVRMVRLTQFHGTASGSRPRMKFIASDTADVIEGHCADPTARLPKVQHFQVLVSRIEEKDAVHAVLERHLAAVQRE